MAQYGYQWVPVDGYLNGFPAQFWVEVPLPADPVGAYNPTVPQNPGELH